MDTEPEPSPRRRRRWPLVAALVLAAGAVAGVLAVQHRNADAPVAAAREYLDAIAGGDAATANTLVDPKSAGADLDLLSNEMLASARQRIQVDDVTLDPAVDPTEETAVDVLVEYRLGTERAVASLRAERAGTTAGVLDDWRVTEPLLVPLRLTTNVAMLGTARLGAADVAVQSVAAEAEPERILVYPAVYGLRGSTSRHLAAEPVAVTALDSVEVSAQVDYAATERLHSLVTERLDAHVAACATGAAVDGCPYAMTDALAAGGVNPRVDRPVSVTRIVPEHKHCDQHECQFGVETTTGSFTYTGGDGTAEGAAFQVSARLVVTAADEVDIEFY